MHLRPRFFIAGLTLLLSNGALDADGVDALSLSLGKIFAFFFLTLGPRWHLPSSRRR